MNRQEHLVLVQNIELFKKVGKEYLELREAEKVANDKANEEADTNEPTE
jgi:hypothetical protein